MGQNVLVVDGKVRTGCGGGNGKLTNMNLAVAHACHGDFVKPGGPKNDGHLEGTCGFDCEKQTFNTIVQDKESAVQKPKGRDFVLFNSKFMETSQPRGMYPKCYDVKFSDRSGIWSKTKHIFRSAAAKLSTEKLRKTQCSGVLFFQPEFGQLMSPSDLEPATQRWNSGKSLWARMGDSFTTLPTGCARQSFGHLCGEQKWHRSLNPVISFDWWLGACTEEKGNFHYVTDPASFWHSIKNIGSAAHSHIDSVEKGQNKAQDDNKHTYLNYLNPTKSKHKYGWYYVRNKNSGDLKCLLDYRAQTDPAWPRQYGGKGEDQKSEYLIQRTVEPSFAPELTQPFWATYDLEEG